MFSGPSARTHGHAAPRILLVDDDRDLLVPLAEQLRLDGFDVTTARDGDEAMRFLRREGPFARAARPDLILLDLNLPGKDGREVLHDIKRDEDLKKIPVVILTTSQAEEDVMRAYGLHANAYMTKPVDFDGFVSVVKGISDYWFTLVKLPPKI
jgi:DNA-binding response OmpR family regulator